MSARKLSIMGLLILPMAFWLRKIEIKPSIDVTIYRVSVLSSGVNCVLCFQVNYLFIKNKFFVFPSKESFKNLFNTFLSHVASPSTPILICINQQRSY
jgi:hypothetical protein